MFVTSTGDGKMSENAANTMDIGVGYELTPDQREIVDAGRRYFMDRLHPLAQRMDDEEWWPADAFRELGEMGFLGLTVGQDYGGQGLDMLTTGAICEAMGEANHAFCLSWAAHDNLCLNNIYRNASEEQRRRYVPALCSGEKLGALALTEPGAGSDALGSMATTARREGDKYLLNGRKLYITNGPEADILLVYAKTSPDKGAKGISAFIVEKEFPGFEVAQKLDKMGFRGSPTAELVFDDCEVPLDNRIGEEDSGVAVVMSGLDLERAMVAPIGVGMAQRALDLSLEYATQRRQFDAPIGSFQMVQSKLADMYIRIETARTFCYRTLAACEGLEKGAGGRGEIHKLTAAAVFYAADVFEKVITDAVQIFGGAGYMREMEINRLYRGSKLLEIGAGTQEVRKIIIAEDLLKNA
jgi:isovaleryl-CoA dehydrogenase